MNGRMRVLVGVIGSIALSFLVSCGGGSSSSTPPPPPVVSIAITPTTANITFDETVQFSTTVTGSSNRSVTWSASEGTVNNGLFTPTAHSGTYTVTATSQADTSKSASATVNVTDPVVSVSINPATKTIAVTETAQFTATVTGSSNTAVAWSASEGTVNNGLFTPPTHSGTYTVTATSQADTSKSASATVTVTAPAAQFSSTPVTDASEGTAYTYTVVATDPAGTLVTYALTAAPDAATINGNTITWTPTRAQARIENTFTVTASTAAGGTGTQTWTVTPTGIIRGSWIDKYWTADGLNSAPHDIADVHIAALVPQGDGGLTEVAGAGNADGTFTIPNVPGGRYWLVFDREYYRTESSSFDLGSDYIGRPYNPSGQVSTSFSFDLTGLVPPQTPGYVLQLLSPSASSLYWTRNGVDSGMTTFTFNEGPATVADIDPSIGEATYVLQHDGVELSGVEGQFQGVTSGLVLNSLRPVPGGLTAVAGPMGGTPSSVTFNIKGSDWAGLLTASGPVPPDAIDPFWAEISVLPFATTGYAWSRSGYQTRIAGINARTSADGSFGPFSYVNPYPSSWKPVFMAMQTATFSITLPGATLPGTYRVAADFWTDTMPTGPIAPLMSAVGNPKINNVNFFDPGSSNGPVTITWTPPTGLAPYGYEIIVWTFTSNYERIGYLYTAATSIEVPSVLLNPGSSYVFTIRAMADSRANIETSPWRSGLPIADAQIVSGVLTVSGLASSASVEFTAQSVKKGITINHPRGGHELRFLKPMVKTEVRRAK